MARPDVQIHSTLGTETGARLPTERKGGHQQHNFLPDGAAQIQRQHRGVHRIHRRIRLQLGIRTENNPDLPIDLGPDLFQAPSTRAGHRSAERRVPDVVSIRRSGHHTLDRERAVQGYIETVKRLMVRRKSEISANRPPEEVADVSPEHSP